MVIESEISHQPGAGSMSVNSSMIVVITYLTILLYKPKYQTISKWNKLQKKTKTLFAFYEWKEPMIFILNKYNKPKNILLLFWSHLI